MMTENTIFTAEEKIMFQVMRAIYESSIPIDFKGSIVLKAYLLEKGYWEEIRHTVDIDANWNSDIPPSAEQMVESLQNVIRENGIDLDVKCYRMYGEKRSAGFELRQSDTGELLFTMDIDVNRPASKTRIYEIAGINFCGVSPSQILADKIAVVSSDKVFRRIKDVVDLFYLSGIFDFNIDEISQTLTDSKRSLDDFNGFLHRPEDLKHAYEKFRFTGDVNKPAFEEVYLTVKRYIRKIIPENNTNKN